MQSEFPTRQLLHFLVFFQLHPLLLLHFSFLIQNCPTYFWATSQENHEMLSRKLTWIMAPEDDGGLCSLQLPFCYQNSKTTNYISNLLQRLHVSVSNLPGICSRETKDWKSELPVPVSWPLDHLSSPPVHESCFRQTALCHHRAAWLQTQTFPGKRSCFLIHWVSAIFFCHLL